MSESERTLVPRGAKQGRRPSIAEMQARIGILEAELAAAHGRETAIAEVLRERADELAARNSEMASASNISLPRSMCSRRCRPRRAIRSRCSI